MAVVAGQKRPAEVPIDSPLRFRRTGYVFGRAPAEEPVPEQLPLRVDEVLRAAEKRAAARAAAAARPAEPPVAAAEAAQPGLGPAGPAGPGGPEPRLVDCVSGEVLRLQADGKTTIGRSSSCSLVVGERHVSGQHCILHCSEECVHVEDVSSNSTYVNGAPLQKGRRVPLQHDDRLTLTRHGGGWRFLSVPGP
mmetsp:Transcript_48559/g.155113  ORF Transcript_48559/g.155113 Transcript_48559/m.155113 type:complete len:193 (-) Transcript_48559:84-662(-)